MGLLKQILLRLLAIPITLLVITATLYGIIMLAPAEERASLYLPPRPPPMTEEAMQNVLNRLVEEHGLNDPYPAQYAQPLPVLVDVYPRLRGADPVWGGVEFAG
jgi:ABC-type dipeptide/oligopeptide/nickel transport system permease component